MKKAVWTAGKTLDPDSFFIYQESRTIYTTRPSRQKRSVLLFAGKAVILYGSSQEIKYGIPAEQEKLPDRRLSLKMV